MNDDELEARLRADLHARAAGLPTSDRPPMVDAALVEVRPPLDRVRRSRLMVVGGLAAASALVAFVLVTGGGDEQEVQPAEVSTAPIDSETPVASEDPTTSAAPPTSAVVTTGSIEVDPSATSVEVAPDGSTVPVPPPTGMPVADPALTEQLADIRAQAMAALSQLDSVRFTAEHVSTGYTTVNGVPTEASTTVAATLMSDGRTWTEADDGSWSSFDPTTGTARFAYRSDADTLSYEEFGGWTGPVVGAVTNLPVDVAGLGWTGLPVTSIDEVSAATGPAWQLRVDPAFDDASSETWLIDQATGLVVGHEFARPSHGDMVPDVHDSFTVTSLETGVDMAAAFPGTIPDGAGVLRPAQMQSQVVDRAGAAAAFGAPIFVPADLPADARFTVQTLEGQPVGTTRTDQVSLSIVIPHGFLRSVVTIQRSVDVEVELPTNPSVPTNASVPDTTIVVEEPPTNPSVPDEIPTNPSVPDDLPELSGGALAGEPYALVGTGGYLNMADPETTHFITVQSWSLSNDDAVAIAESLEKVAP